MSDTPRVLGHRYEVGDLIGRGGMAQVHLGYDTRLSRTVAIKILRTDLAQDPMFLARFRREAQSAAALNHPSIVSVYDTGEEQIVSTMGKEIPLPYIVMEYVKGRTVASLLTDGDPVPISEAVQIIVGVLSALEYSHHEGIIHRDIKPGNVMLTPDGKVKVMDFGIARAIADSAATMTQTNSVVGTAQYLSPEQARGEVVDARSDLYSAGCLFYELLTGKPPFTGDSAVSVAYQHVSETPRPASLIAPDIPDSIDRVVMKSLAKGRDNRYQSAAEFREDVLSAARGEGVDAPSVTSWNMRPVPVVAPTQVATAVEGNPTTGTMTALSEQDPEDTGVQPAVDEKSKKRNKIMIWAGVIILILAIAGIVYAITTSGGDDEPTPTPTATAVQMVDVPSLDGLDRNGIQSALEDAGLVYKAGIPQPDDNVEQGYFISSTPTPGTSVERGSEVEVILSSGPDSVQVPDIVGKTTSEASSLLADQGLRIGSSETVDSTSEKDTVVSSDPQAGSSVEEGTAVNIEVASGMNEIPNVTGFDLAKAKATLEDAGFVANPNYQDSDQTPDTVLGMNPDAGSRAEVGSKVTIYVAREPENENPGPTPTEEPSESPSSDDGENGDDEG
ncbi:Stk1 family PASTA domain-containing Ser/Thr kinase [Ancrocorticia populi]|uniref:non-specific serine/threonine protein kinase n=1 Tax=Ancrocorticia populi TaxID=2175228 RepID=A0A2V1K654_9ACTO|nr:Stk1 family PASTA domain-containing Ser/Thr kinase [Ancrocorticia populi]PWF26918.1 Stk1 family PASTA domain-containing Ser/Thr kinase [Ancrocorticia populi]